MILHVATQADWKMCISSSEYFPAAYLQDGFIHCCKPEQLSGVLDRYFKDQSDLLLLYIDDKLVEKNLKYEGIGEELFPHLFKPLKKNSVVKVEVLR
jgi:uncharacterized protein (DUF952 family)